MEPILQPMIDMLQHCPSYSEAMEKLAGMYPEMDSRALEKSLEKAAYLAEVYGGAEAQNA